MELRRAISVIRRFARPLLGAALLGGLVGYLVSVGLPKEYDAENTLLVGQALSSTSPDLIGLETSSRLSETYAQLATTRPQLERVIKRLGLSVTPDELANRVRVSANREDPLIRIHAKASSAVDAAAIANAVAEELVAVSPTITGAAGETQFVADQLRAIHQEIQQAQAEIDTLLSTASPNPDRDARLLALQTRLESLRSTYAFLLSYSAGSIPNALTIVERAYPPTEPTSPRPVFNAVLAAVLAVLIGIGIAFAFEQLDDTLKKPEDIDAVLGLPTLAQVPQLRRPRDGHLVYGLVALLTPRSTAAESFRTLRTNIEFSSVDEPIRSILVTSAGAAEGKTMVAANLAVVLAESGKTVLLVDADLRRPDLHTMFRLANSSGLTSLLHAGELGVRDVAVDTEVANLRVIPSGPLPASPAELLGSHRMRAVVASLEQAADVVVFDSSPAALVTDPAVLSSNVDGIVFVVAAGRTRRALARDGHEALSRVGSRVLGAVLNGTPADRQHEYYGYTEDHPATQHHVPSTSPG